MDYKEIQDLIKLVKRNHIAELKIEKEDFKINIKSQVEEPTVQQIALPMSQPQASPVVSTPTPAVQPTVQEPAPQITESNLVEIKSPMIGTFYRAAGPDKDPFVAVGDEIKSGQTICMIEAMKLFNEIEAETEGKIVKILVEDATPVEFDQPLFLIDPQA